MRLHRRPAGPQPSVDVACARFARLLPLRVPRPARPRAAARLVLLLPPRVGEGSHSERKGTRRARHAERETSDRGIRVRPVSARAGRALEHEDARARLQPDVDGSRARRGLDRDARRNDAAPGRPLSSARSRRAVSSRVEGALDAKEHFLAPGVELAFGTHLDEVAKDLALPRLHTCCILARATELRAAGLVLAEEFEARPQEDAVVVVVGRRLVGGRLRRSRKRLTRRPT